MEIKGKVISRMEARGGNGKKGEWKTQQYVIEHELDSQFPKHAVIEFGLKPENVENAQKYLHKDTIATFYLDIDAREYEGKWYNSVRCWKFVLEGAEEAKPTTATEQRPTPIPNATPAPANTETAPATSDTDLPF